MAKRKKKSKWTEGVLARDSKDAGGVREIIFFHGSTQTVRRQDVVKVMRGMWFAQTHNPDITLSSWTEQEWLKHYKKSDMPRRGSARECFLEL